MSAPLNRIRLRLPRADFELRVDLSLPGQGITVVFGPSGCGKTSLLRCVAGLTRASDAFIAMGDDVWQNDTQRLFVPTWRRPLGYVPQEPSLFEHLDVLGNLRYGMVRARSATGQASLDAAIELLGIGALMRRQPAQLSGGERQRVAIARALATQPRLLLLDEPLAALDLARKREILPWLERLRDELRTPMLYVTHSADELARLADHLVVLERGQVRASGPTAQVLSAIADPALPGEEAGALLHGQVVERDARWHMCRVAFPGGSLWLSDADVALDRPVRLRVLARDVSIATQEPGHSSIQNHLPALIEAMAADAHPSQVLVRLQCGPSILLARITRRAWDQLGLGVGQPVWLQVKSVALVR